MMRLRNTLILVAIFALLAGYVYFVEMQKPAEDTQAKEKEKYVFTLGKDDVNTLQVKDGDKSVYLVKDSAGKWYVGGIGAAEADANRMNSIISSLTGLRASRIITDISAGLAMYGLENPAMEVNLNIGGGSPQVESLMVGDKTPQGFNYYAQRKGSNVLYLVPEYIISDLKGLVNNPPYAPTPTPGPEATATVTGTLGITPTVTLTAPMPTATAPAPTVTATVPVTP